MARTVTLPPDVDLVAPRDQLAFLDSQSLTLTSPLTALEAWTRLKARPMPLLGTAIRIRDAVASRFGVRRIGGFGRTPDAAPEVGGMLDFFRVERADPATLTLTERDRHLDVMTCITCRDGVLAITASVITHNLFGRVYMIPVAPAHRVIVWLMLRRMARQSAAGDGNAG